MEEEEWWWVPGLESNWYRVNLLVMFGISDQVEDGPQAPKGELEGEREEVVKQVSIGAIDLKGPLPLDS